MTSHAHNDIHKSFWKVLFPDINANPVSNKINASRKCNSKYPDN